MKLTNGRLQWIAGGLALRIVLLGWGMYQDKHAALPYTDIDYAVFTSAAQHVAHSCPLEAVISVPPQEEYEDLINPPEAPGLCAQGYLAAAARFLLQMERELNDPEVSPFGKELGTPDVKTSLFVFSLLRPLFKILGGLGNPFARPTYRYTPLLALLLAPGQYLDEPWRGLFGKLLFVLADVAIALLMWDIMDLRARQRRTTDKSGTDTTSWLPGVLWLLNPFPAQIATRGSSESILGLLVLAFLDVTLRSSPEASLALPAIVESKATHPTVNGDADKEGEEVVPTPEEPTEALAPLSNWSNAAIFAPFLFALAIHWKLYPVIYAASLVPHLASSARIRGPSASSSSWKNSFGAVARYGFVAVYSLVGFCGPVYLIWGDAYLKETFLHHFHRSDHRHNFSPHFLGAYLSNVASSNGLLSTETSSYLSPILGFLPQLLLCAFIGFSLGGKDLIAACAAQTAAFVMLNKVSTSQYFTWFLWFLPIVAPSLQFASWTEAALVLFVWVASQAAWLSQAYLLEFKALDTYLSTYIASLVLVASHAWVLVRCLTAWGRSRETRLRASMAAASEKKDQ